MSLFLVKYQLSQYLQGSVLWAVSKQEQVDVQDINFFFESFFCNPLQISPKISIWMSRRLCSVKKAQCKIQLCREISYFSCSELYRSGSISSQLNPRGPSTPWSCKPIPHFSFKKLLCIKVQSAAAQGLLTTWGSSRYTDYKHLHPSCTLPSC